MPDQVKIASLRKQAEYYRVLAATFAEGSKEQQQCEQKAEELEATARKAESAQ